MTIPILIDTDIGDDIDDALALAFALGSPEFELVGVTTVYGDVRTRARIARRLLRESGRGDVPVIPGAVRPMGFDWHEGTAAEVCSQRVAVESESEGLIAPYSAADFIARTVRARPNEIHIVTIGACTNVGMALCNDPSLAALISRVVTLGGYLPPRQAQPEWNMRYDPVAAASLARSGVNWTVIPADVQGDNAPGRAELDALAGSARPADRFLAELIVLMARHKGRGNPAVQSIADVNAIHAADVMTLASFLVPDAMGLRRGRVVMDSRGGMGVNEDAQGSHAFATRRLEAGAYRGEIMRRVRGEALLAPAAKCGAEGRRG